MSAKNRTIVISLTDHEIRTTPGWVRSGRSVYYTTISASTGVGTPSRGTTYRRYNDFWSLHQALTKKYGSDVIPGFIVPRSKILDDHYSAEFIDDRKYLLGVWINATVNVNAEVREDDLVIEFLELKTSTVLDESLPGFSSTAKYDTTGEGIPKIFSTTADEKVRLSEKDKEYLPQQVMSVYRITDDDL